MEACKRKHNLWYKYAYNIYVEKHIGRKDLKQFVIPDPSEENLYQLCDILNDITFDKLFSVRNIIIRFSGNSRFYVTEINYKSYD